MAHRLPGNCRSSDVASTASASGSPVPFAISSSARVWSAWIASAKTRSEMSRMKPMNIGGPLDGSREMLSSTGNSVPSARIALISILRPRTCAAPVSR